MSSRLADSSRPRSHRNPDGFVGAALVCLPPFLLARVGMGLGMFLTWVLSGTLAQAGDAPDARGLWVWDAGWYRSIAENGYGDPVHLRFFPLLPLLGRGFGVLLGGRVDLALLTLSTAAALAYGALLVILVRFETGDEGTARRAAWLAMLAPGAGVLAIAYTEALSGVLTVGFFLALRRRVPLAAAALGILSGLVRPNGLLLVVPALVEMWLAYSAGRIGSRRAWSEWTAAALSPVVGTGLYCLWVWRSYGEALLPYTIQTRRGLRGGVAADPRQHLFTTTHAGLDWRLQLVLLLVALALLVVVARRLSFSYAAWSALTLAAAVTSAEGHSLPRYVASTFPLLIGAALVSPGRRWRWALLASLLPFGYLAFLGFTPDYVP